MRVRNILLQRSLVFTLHPKKIKIKRVNTNFLVAQASEKSDDDRKMKKITFVPGCTDYVNLYRNKNLAWEMLQS